MLLVPATTPLTTPAAVIVAIVALLLVQLPPAGALPSAVVLPTQTSATPLITDGSPLTVTVVCLEQPVGNVYIIVAVPDIIPDTTPVLDIVATLVLVDTHTPPVVVLDSVIVSPSHTCVGPAILAGSGFTTTPAVVRHVVGNV
jgi:hypothetical protein